MNSSSDLLLWVFLWIGALAWILWTRRGGRFVGVGLSVSYVIGMSLIYLPGAIIYALPWYAVDEDTASAVRIGLDQGLIGLAAFGFGALLGPAIWKAFGAMPAASRARDLTPPTRAYIVLGLASYVLALVIGRVATLTALVSSGWNLAVLGLSLAAWEAWRSGRAGASLRWLVVGLSLPLVTTVSKGYIFSGIAALIPVLAFTLSYRKMNLLRVVSIGILCSYVGLSLFVTYMRDRITIREAVWGQASLSTRLDTVTSALGAWEWFDPANEAHLELIDERLNQNYLIGVAAKHLDLGVVDFASGETLVDAAGALIPRFIWPDKPFEAGSGNLVSRFTGIPFSSDTSVGVGHVMEFYINYGTVGVVLGLFLIGSLVSLVDAAAEQSFRERNWARLALWFLPGLSLLQVGGSLVELTASAAASIVVAVVTNVVLAYSVRLRASRTGSPLGRLHNSASSPALRGG